MPENLADRRVRKTRALLRQGLIGLMREKSVQEKIEPDTLAYKVRRAISTAARSICTIRMLRSCCTALKTSFWWNLSACWGF